MPVDGANGPLAALGVSSAAGSFGQASISQYRARRDNVRDVQRVFSGLGQAASIELRFVLARPQATSAQLQAVAEEQRRYQDMVYLNITESRFNCALKFLLWFAHCQTAFPSARFYAIADDDTFIQLAHFEADLRTIPAAGYVVWGLVMWSVKHCRKRCPNESGTWGSDRAATAACAWRLTHPLHPRRYPFYNNVTMVTHHDWSGWQYTDAGAVKARRYIESCRESRRAGGGAAACSRKVSKAALDAIEADGLSEQPPFPVVNGPMFAVSRSLGNLLVSDSVPRAYLEQLSNTPRVRAALSRKNGPRKSNFACWPVGDSIVGLWLSRLAAARQLPMTLVNTPFMVQHHPWPAVMHGAFSNSSIVLHGLKKERNQRKFYQFAMQRGMGPLVPFRRKCGSCAALGWSSWPTSPVRSWTCCGCDAVGESKRQCTGRMNGEEVT